MGPRAPTSTPRRPPPGATPPALSTPMASPTWTWSPARSWETGSTASLQRARPSWSTTWDAGNSRSLTGRQRTMAAVYSCQRWAVVWGSLACRGPASTCGRERPVVLTETWHGRRAKSWNSTHCVAKSPGRNQLRLASRRASASSSSRQMLASSRLTSSQAESRRCPAEAPTTTVSFLTWDSILQIMLRADHKRHEDTGINLSMFHDRSDDLSALFSVEQFKQGNCCDHGRLVLYNPVEWKDHGLKSVPSCHFLFFSHGCSFGMETCN